jgi:hypothetical protein
MTIQYNATTRNAKLDAIETTNLTSCSMEIRTTAQPANCAAASTGALLCTINLPSDWMGAAAAGSKAKAGVWSATASGSGTAAHFRLYNSQATKDGTTCFMQGTIGQGSGDLSLDNTTIASSQTVTINTFTINDGNP